MLWYIFKLCIIILVVLTVYLLIRRPWQEKSVRAWVETAFMVFMAGLYFGLRKAVPDLEKLAR